MRDFPSTTFLRVRAVLPVRRSAQACPRVSTHSYTPLNQLGRPRRAAFFMENIGMRGPWTFRKRDVTRAIQAVVASGIEGRVEIEPNGKIVIVIGKSAAQNFIVPIAANDNTWSDVDAA
jgi:hypothetical protein